MPRADLDQAKFERWLARRRTPMKRGICPLTNFCGTPVGRGLIYGSDIDGIEAMRLPGWAVSFSYYFDGLDGHRPRIAWARRAVAASTVRRVYHAWKTASPTVLRRLAAIRMQDEQI